MAQKISVAVCTYNGKGLIENCLDSILSQSYRNFEVLCIDGFSSDGTLDIINRYKKQDKRIKLIMNKNRLPEGTGNGKWLGFNKAKGEIFAIIDQDNVLQRKDLFANVVKLMKKEKNIAGILGGLKHDRKDSPVVRYVALTGTDSFFAYRSIDFLRNLNSGHNKEIGKIKLATDNMLLTGGNCFFYLRKNVKKVGGYTRDVNTIRELIKSGCNNLLIMKDATKHYTENNIINLVKKKFMWGKKYFTHKKTEDSFNYLPGTQKEAIAFTKNLIFNLLIIPDIVYAIKLYTSSKDAASFLFPFIAFANTIAYGSNFLIQKLVQAA